MDDLTYIVLALICMATVILTIKSCKTDPVQEARARILERSYRENHEEEVKTLKNNMTKIEKDKRLLTQEITELKKLYNKDPVVAEIV